MTMEGNMNMTVIEQRAARNRRAYGRENYHAGTVTGDLKTAAMTIILEGRVPGVRELASVIGVSPTAVYRHFTSRDDLLASLAVDGFARMAAHVEGCAKRALGYVDFASDNPTLFRLLFDTARKRDKNTSRVRAAAEKLGDALIDPNEPFDPEDDAQGARRGVWAAVHGVAELVVAGAITLEQATDLLEDAS